MITDERLAELIGMFENIAEVLQSRKLPVGAYPDSAAALRELQALRQRVQPTHHANVSWPCNRCGQQIWLDHECPHAT